MVIYDNSAVFEAGGTTSPGWNHVIGSGNNRILLIWFCGESGDNVDWAMSAVTAGGASCSHLITTMNGSGFGVSFWYCLAPASGTIAIAGTCSHSLFGCMGSTSWSDVDQVNIGTPNSLVASGSTPSFTMTATSGDVVAAGGGWLNTTLSHSHTERFKTETDIFHRAIGVSQDATGDTAISFTLGTGVIHYFAGVALKTATPPAPVYGSLGQFDPELRIAAWF